MDRRIPIQIQSIASGNAYLSAAWGVGNNLASYSAPRNNRQSTNGAIAQKGEVHTVSFETSLYTPIFRKLVNESAQTFLALQKMASEEESKFRKLGYEKRDQSYI